MLISTSFDFEVYLVKSLAHRGHKWEESLSVKCKSELCFELFKKKGETSRNNIIEDTCSRLIILGCITTVRE